MPKKNSPQNLVTRGLGWTTGDASQRRAERHASYCREEDVQWAGLPFERQDVRRHLEAKSCRTGGDW